VIESPGTVIDSLRQRLRRWYTFYNPPAALFWSLTVYDAETASGADAKGQEYPSLNSMDDLKFDKDGSITFYVGPEKPQGSENWLKTVPGRGWFAIIRWYGPKQEFFDRKYKPGDFVKVDCAGCSHTALLSMAFLSAIGALRHDALDAVFAS